MELLFTSLVIATGLAIAISCCRLLMSQGKKRASRKYDNESQKKFHGNFDTITQCFVECLAGLTFGRGRIAWYRARDPLPEMSGHKTSLACLIKMYRQSSVVHVTHVSVTAMTLKRGRVLHMQ